MSIFRRKLSPRDQLNVDFEQAMDEAREVYFKNKRLAMEQHDNEITEPARKFYQETAKKIIDAYNKTLCEDIMDIPRG